MSNYEFVKTKFSEYNIKKYNIDETIVNSNKFNRDDFMIKLMSKHSSKIDNKHKTLFEMIALAVGYAMNGIWGSNDESISSSGAAYSCTGVFGAERYYFYRGSGGASIQNLAVGSNWTTVNLSSNSSTNTYTFIGYDTYSLPLGIQWDADYQIKVIRTGSTCKFIRSELY